MEILGTSGRVTIRGGPLGEASKRGLGGHRIAGRHPNRCPKMFDFSCEEVKGVCQALYRKGSDEWVRPSVKHSSGLTPPGYSVLIHTIIPMIWMLLIILGEVVANNMMLIIII